jgi:hypothetical protein
MKTKLLLIFGVTLLITAVITISCTSNDTAGSSTGTSASHPSNPSTPTANHPQGNFDPKRVPAHFETPPTLASLGPTLPEEKFKGQTREAYRVVKEIPQTIAQLPCYCHCDRGNGHKSLYSCFEDDHAAHCGVCINEALLAYQLEKKEKLSPVEIRKRIIAQYTTN